MAEEIIKTENSLNTGKTQWEVGYKKPPKEYQFKLGESGNIKGKGKGVISPIQTVKNFFIKNPKEFKKFIREYIKDPANKKHIVEMIDGKPKEAIDLTTGGESFFRPTEEEKARALKALKEIND